MSRIGIIVYNHFSCSALPFNKPVPTSTFILSPDVIGTEEIQSGFPTYAKPGPYTVGMVNLQMPGDDWSLHLFIWYPVKDDKAPNLNGSPYPLVIYAPGWGSPALEGYGYLLQQIAAYGFVAMSWDPRAEAEGPLNKWYAPIAYRPLDLQFLLDYLASMTAQGGPLEGMVNWKQIAIAGHSMGGGTALQESGAPIDFS